MPLADDPLGQLGKVMDHGFVNEVFICAMLLKEEQKTAGVELLVASLEKAHANLVKAVQKGATRDEEEHLKRGMSIISNILATLTGEQRGVDPVLWRKYADGLRSAPPKE
jgi:hypothetical protein